MSTDPKSEGSGPPGGLYAGFVWGIASLFFLYEYALRVAPSVMVDALMAHFQVSAAALGTLSAFYLYAYSPMQLVVGMLLDRFGGRRTMSLAAACCGVGTLLFAMTDSYAVAGVGRALMGVGSAFAFVGALYVATNWFPPKYFALLAGGTTTLGMLGGASQTPLAVISGLEGWRPTLIGIAGVGFLLMALLWIFVPNRPEWVADTSDGKPDEGVFHNLGSVLKNPQSWLLGAFAGLVYVPTSAFAALWGIPFLEQAYHVDKTVAASIVSTVFVGWAVGGPLAGLWSDSMQRRKPPMILGSLGVLLSISAVLYVPGLHVWMLYPLLFAVGFFSGGQIVVFAAVHECNMSRAKGSALAVTNMLCMATGALLQPLIGVLLDQHGGTLVSQGHHVYGLADYRYALTLIPIFCLGAFLISLVVRETHAVAPQ